MADGIERRRFPRIEANAYVDYTGEHVLLYHRVQNISLGGVGLKAPKGEQPGALVELVINFPDLDTSLAVHGKVAWVSGEGPVHMGIRYVDLSEDDRATIQRYLDRLRK